MVRGVTYKRFDEENYKAFLWIKKIIFDIKIRVNFIHIP